MLKVVIVEGLMANIDGKVDYVEGLRLYASELLVVDYVRSFTQMVPHALTFVESHIIPHNDVVLRLNCVCRGLVARLQNGDFI